MTSQSFNLTQQQQQIPSAAVIAAAAAGPASNAHQQQHPQTSHIQVYEPSMEQSSNTFDASSVNRPETESIRSET